MSAAFTQVFDLLKDYRKQIGLGVFLCLLPAYFQVWLPLLLGKAIDEGISQNNHQLFVQIAALFLGIQFLLFFLQYLTNYFLMNFGFNILVQYRTQLLEKILSYKMPFFDRLPAGKISTRLSNDVNSLQELFSSALVSLIGNFVTVVGVSVAMLVVNWKLGLFALSIAPAILFLVKFFRKRIRRRVGFMRKTMSNLNAYAGESFGGMTDVRGLGARIENQKEYETGSNKLARRHYQAGRENSLFNPLIFLMTSIMNVSVLFGGVLLYQRGQVSVGDIAAFLTYVNFFAWPMQELAEKFSVLQQSLGAVDRLVEVSSGDPEKSLNEKEFERFHTLRFENVNFSYEAVADPALKQINFQVKRGQKIALIGETGAGKTTTCSVLMRFYEPTEGKILFDSEDYRNFNLQSYRSSIGWVSQDVFLFSTTLRENLRFYNEEISDEEIWNLLELLELKEWAKKLPGGLDYEIHERGSSLSSGQRQLLSLARALLPKPKILIFDEATSHIDSQTEYAIQESLERLWKTKDFQEITAFVIAHRLSTIRRCEEVLVFKNAQIVERGSFEQLMKQKGYAYELQQKQFRESNSEQVLSA